MTESTTARTMDALEDAAKNEKKKTTVHKTQKHALTNAQFAVKDTGFRNLCAAAGVEPTPRQASKFRRKVGKAWRYSKGQQ